jgi:hypothetical protein
MDNKKFCHITTKIDNKAPRFPIFKYLKSYKLLSDVARVRDIDKENMKLLKRMNYIHRIKVSVPLFLPLKLKSWHLVYIQICQMYLLLYIFI